LEIVKLFIKAQPQDLARFQHILLQERDALRGVPNVLSYETVIETEKAGYAIRNYIATNLYDRISTRPFLAPIEKTFIAFQLLKGLTKCHEKGTRHGDIKTENVLITSWNWALIADFASYKPIFLPDVYMYG
jgi:phosphoinositide-3-kinase, regulatory subunit 4